MLMSMAICHILPEADAMYSKYLSDKEAAELASTPLLEHDHDGDGHDDHAEEDHEEEEDEHHDEDEEEDKEETKDDHDDHDDHDEHGEGHGFPFSYTLFLVGFLIMLALDKVLFKQAEIKVENNKTISRESI